MLNKVLQKYKDGKTSLGTFISSGSSVIAEAIGIAGLDYFIVDIEHSPFGLNEVTECIKAGELKGITSFVRICDINRNLILKALDAGAMGLIIPGVRKIEEIQEIIALAKYTPLGKRGFCPTRVCDYGYNGSMSEGILKYTELCNQQTMVIPQCETVEALSMIEDIVNMEGVDGIFIGPFDLSLDMGKPAQFDDPEILAAFSRIKEACKKAKKPAYIFAPNMEAAKKHFDNGFDSVTFNADVNIVIDTFKKIRSDLKSF